jgi:DNA polymerase-3 subunit delta'
MRAFDGLAPWLDESFARLSAAALAGRLGHGWLLSGPRGVGKSNLAFVLADRLLEGRLAAAPPGPAAPRELLKATAALADGIDLHPDLHRVRAEEGKRTIAVEQIRAMTAELALTPHIAGLKLVIIERADTMTTEAANALLKSLEEPTPDTWLFLLAERPGRLPATVRSRCQQLALRPPDADTTRQWLARDELAADGLPGALRGRAPLALAALLDDEENYNNYNKIYMNIKLLSEGRADPHVIADDWHRGDTELALGCLIENLQARLRGRLVPGHSNPITDSRAGLTENRLRAIPTAALFAGLQQAEHLREQLGRGTNVELALKALLLGLEPSDRQRVRT